MGEGALAGLTSSGTIQGVFYVIFGNHVLQLDGITVIDVLLRVCTVIIDMFIVLMASFCLSDYLFKLLLIGDSGVGKSCLLLRFAVSSGQPIQSTV